MAWNDGALERLRFSAVPFRPDRHYVYIAWGADRSRPLYVGKGDRPFIRIGLHLASAKWAPEVVEYEAHAFGSAAEALEAEKAAIYELDPIHNVIRSLPRYAIDEQFRQQIAANRQIGRAHV